MIGLVHLIRGVLRVFVSILDQELSWCSKKQDTVVQSTAEAEFINATTAVNQVLWLRKIMCHLSMEQKEVTEVYTDITKLQFLLLIIQLFMGELSISMLSCFLERCAERWRCEASLLQK